MGLDMYLSKRTYVKHYDFKGKENFEIKVKQGGKIVPFIKPKEVSYLISEVIYWRKANAIHNWFVNNVQGGEDDCGTHSVSPEQIQELIDACTFELTHRVKDGEESKGAALKPTSGFFFGDTTKDDYYYDNLKETVKVLETELALQKKYELCDDFEYHSSW